MKKARQIDGSRNPALWPLQKPSQRVGCIYLNCLQTD